MKNTCNRPQSFSRRHGAAVSRPPPVGFNKAPWAGTRSQSLCCRDGRWQHAKNTPRRWTFLMRQKRPWLKSNRVTGLIEADRNAGSAPHGNFRVFPIKRPPPLKLSDEFTFKLTRLSVPICQKSFRKKWLQGWPECVKVGLGHTYEIVDRSLHY